MAASHYEVDQEYQVIVDPSVYDRMFHHFMFLAEVDVDAARKLEQDMVATLRSLSFLPQRHPYYDNPHMPAKRYRAAQVSNYHRIIFVVEVDKVYVDDIIDSRSQYYSWRIMHLCLRHRTEGIFVAKRLAHETIL